MRVKVRHQITQLHREPQAHHTLNLSMSGLYFGESQSGLDFGRRNVESMSVNDVDPAEYIRSQHWHHISQQVASTQRERVQL
jgi:hypothetical protein